jgi:hypothetical protein
MAGVHEESISYDPSVFRKVADKLYASLVFIMIVVGLVLGIVIVMSQTIWWHNTVTPNVASSKKDIGMAFGCTDEHPICSLYEIIVPMSIIFLSEDLKNSVSVAVDPMHSIVYVTNNSRQVHTSMRFDRDTGKFSEIGAPAGTAIFGVVNLRSSTPSMIFSNSGFPTMSLVDMTDPKGTDMTQQEMKYSCQIGRNYAYQSIAPNQKNDVTRCLGQYSGHNGTVFGCTFIGCGIYARVVNIALNVASRRISVNFPAIGGIVESSTPVSVARSTMFGMCNPDWTFELHEYTPKISEMRGYVDPFMSCFHLQFEGVRRSVGMIDPSDVNQALYYWRS